MSTPNTVSVMAGVALGGLASAASAGDVSLMAGAFGGGYALPLNGLAGMLGFLAIGLLSGRIGGSAVWQLPSVALVGAFATALIGEAGVTLPYAHHGLLVAVAALGVLVTLGGRLPLVSPTLVVAVVGLFEGQPLAQAIHGPHLWPWLGFTTGAVLAMTGGLGICVILGQGTLSLGLRALGASIAGTTILMFLDRL